jgi:3-deoxy-manno-octulosonate cytidylyltransferase (CMP-KDO synthetase)
VHPSTNPSATVVAAIPARYASTRLPAKALLPIAGSPMVEHVWRRAAAADGVDRVVVLTDDERIAEVVRGFGGEVEMTPAACASGTDRIAHAARAWSCEAVINVQGDEPLIDPRSIAAVAAHLRQQPGDEMVTLAAPAADGDLDNPNVVKVVLDLAGHALYFSRAGIPYPRLDPRAAGLAPLRHLGIYGYRRATLLRLAALPPTALERVESLEQLRALANGIRIRVLETPWISLGVDTREDLEAVERELLGGMGSPAGGGVGDRERAKVAAPSPAARVGEGRGERGDATEPLAATTRPRPGGQAVAGRVP